MNNIKYVNGTISVLLYNKEKDAILLGRRKDNGLISLPGGWLEYGEEWVECAKREMKEELDLDLEMQNFKHIKTLNVCNEEKIVHNCAIFMSYDLPYSLIDSVKLKEPDKCEGWEWYTYHDMIDNYTNLGYSLKAFIESNKNCKSFTDLLVII